MLTFKRILFYIVSITWGALLSIPGLIIMLCLLPFGRVKVYHGRLCGVVGSSWGGFNLGCCFLVCKEAQNSDYTCGHECGHGLQNCLWGPLTPFVITIPSAIRYWYRNWALAKGKKLPDYDAIWFEGQATEWGKKYVITDRI